MYNICKAQLQLMMGWMINLRLIRIHVEKCDFQIIWLGVEGSFD